MVRWSGVPLVGGPLVRWSIGPVVHWSGGPLVHRSSGPLVQWSIGAVVNWSIGPLVECQKSKVKCQMPNVNKVKLLSERTSGHFISTAVKVTFLDCHSLIQLILQESR